MPTAGRGILRSADGRPRSLVGHRAEIAQLVEHATENRGVASSNLALGTTIRWCGLSSGSGSVGRASPCQGEGRGFESRLPLHSLVRHPAVSRTNPAAPSSSGRTADFGSVRRGSNPRGAAILKHGRVTRSQSRNPRPARGPGATYPSGLRGRSAKPLFAGSNPAVASTLPHEPTTRSTPPRVIGACGSAGRQPRSSTW